MTPGRARDRPRSEERRDAGNQQAAKAAKEHLNIEAYSSGGLIDQLVYEGFTPAQAEYGVAAAGL